MSKKIAFFITAFAILVSAHSSVAQQAGKVYRVGLLSPGSVRTHSGFLESLRQGMRDAGYVEGRDIIIEARSLSGHIRHGSPIVNQTARLIRTTPGYLIFPTASARTTNGAPLPYPRLTLSPPSAL